MIGVKEAFPVNMTQLAQNCSYAGSISGPMLGLPISNPNGQENTPLLTTSSDLTKTFKLALLAVYWAVLMLLCLAKISC